MNALSDAQAQPSPSSRPKRARLRGTDDPALSACCAIVLHPHPPVDPAASSLDRQRARHVRVHRADEHVVAGGERRHLVVASRRRPLKISPLNTDRPAASLIATLCGTPVSWLSNSMVNGSSAGARQAVVGRMRCPARRRSRHDPGGAPTRRATGRAGEPTAGAGGAGWRTRPVQQAGNGVASGCRLVVRIAPAGERPGFAGDGSTIGSNSSGSRTM